MMTTIIIIINIEGCHVGCDRCMYVNIYILQNYCAPHHEQNIDLPAEYQLYIIRIYIIS